ncbi:hypothetical protein [Rhodothermus marinus]|uniref:hypothetical protein n=1 Tax=Rhodothermus marinus TaxID=29549 RepID=UPI000AD7921C|nr:hypothetical protein [Rhodothermus marinus]
MAVNGVHFNLGNDTGLRHVYVDRDVQNGQTYYYAVVAYDRGYVARDENGNIVVDPEGFIRGIAPSLTTATIKTDLAGQVVSLDINTAVATPRAPAAGYVPPEVTAFERQTIGTGSVDLQLAAPEAVQEGATYEVVFENPSLWQNTPEVSYRVQRETGEVLRKGPCRRD